jgi:serine phosphatase RsbU (regulator of sigma subunit)
MPSSNIDENSVGFTDRILLLYSPSSEEFSTYLSALGNQNYQLEVFENNNISKIPQLTFDLAVMMLANNDDISTHITELKKQFLFPNTPLIIVCHDEVSSLDVSQFPTIEVLNYSQGLSKFLVTVSILLRMRKIRNSHVSAQVEVVSQNAQLRDLNNRFQKDLREAREIHERILPRQLPSFESMVCATSYLPLEVVGGDIFDIWKVREETVGIFLADITGHGLPAAFIASMTKMCLALAPEQEPSSILSFLNRNLSKYLPDGRFITAVCCIIDSTNKILSYCNGGHPPPFLYKNDRNDVISLSDRGMPLNVNPEFAFKTSEIKVNKGDKLYLYSDGVFETSNMDNQMMGLSGLRSKFLELAPNSEIDEVVNGLTKFQEEYSAGRTFKDDVTMIGLELLC